MVAFPRFRREVRVDTGRFYSLLREEYRTIVGPGHWFDMDDRYLRIGFGYPDETALRDGLRNIEQAAERAPRCAREAGGPLRIRSAGARPGS